MAYRIENYIIFLIVIFLLIHNLLAQKYQISCNKPIYINEISQKTLFTKDDDSILTNDKAKHFMGSLISTVFIHQLSTKHFDLEKTESKAIAGGVTFSIGILKESYDEFVKKKKFSWEDLIADAAGIAVGLILVNQP